MCQLARAIGVIKGEGRVCASAEVQRADHIGVARPWNEVQIIHVARDVEIVLLGRGINADQLRPLPAVIGFITVHTRGGRRGKGRGAG